MVAGTIGDAFVCAAIVLAMIVWVMLGSAWHHARRPPFEDHARGDASWVFAGRWVYASAAPGADPDWGDVDAHDDEIGDPWIERIRDARIPCEIVSIERRGGAQPGFQRLLLSADRSGRPTRIRLEFMVDERCAATLVETIRSRLADARADGMQAGLPSLAVDPRSDARLGHVAPSALVLRCAPEPHLQLSTRTTDAAGGAFLRCVVYGIVALVPIAALTGCVGAGLPLVATTAGGTLAVWVAIGVRRAAAARSRHRRGGARFLVVADRTVALAQDHPERPLVGGPAAVVPLYDASRPDRRASMRLVLLPEAGKEGSQPERVHPPVAFAGLDAPSAWGLAEEIERRLRR